MRSVVLGMCALLPIMAADSGMADHDKRVRESATVLSEIMNAGDKAIPQDLLEKAQCVAIVPNLKRAGFILGGKYGKGVITCRTSNHTGWTAPSTIRIEGGSIGLQIGAGETDVVLVVMNQSGMNRLMKDKFTIGGDASVMAGPVGRSAQAQTDAAMKAEILAYSRSHGVFGGISLEGATLRADNEDNEKIYGGPVTQEAILHGNVKATGVATPLFNELNRWAPYKQ